VSPVARSNRRRISVAARSLPESAKTNTINNGSIIANVNPFYDDCGGAAPDVAMTGKNVGNLLNAAGASWGWFYRDFAPASTNGVVATCIGQYNPHYAPFDYYRSTSNPHHLPQLQLPQSQQTPALT
jgi:phospholipase C